MNKFKYILFQKNKGFNKFKTLLAGVLILLVMFGNVDGATAKYSRKAYHAKYTTKNRYQHKRVPRSKTRQNKNTAKLKPASQPKAVPVEISNIDQVTYENDDKPYFDSFFDKRKYYQNRPVRALSEYVEKNSKPAIPAVFSMVNGAPADVPQSPVKPVVLDSKDNILFVGSSNTVIKKPGPDKKKNSVFNTSESSSRVDKFVSAKSAYDYEKVETTVITLRINDKIAYDFEVIVWPDETISVPIKSLAQFLDVAVEQNHVTNSISFLQPRSKSKVSVDKDKNTILSGTDLIEVQNPKLVYVKQGFIVQDEIFVPEELARKLLDVQTEFAKSNCVMKLETGNVLKAFLEINESSQKPSDFVLEEPVKEINSAEKENKKFKIKRVDYSIGTTMNASSNYTTQTTSGAASLGFNSTGNFLGGQYNLGANTYYGPNGLTVGGYRASLDYINPKHELSIGSTNTHLSDVAVPGSNIIGFRFGSTGAADGSSTVPRLIQGKAEDNSYVELFINNIYTDKQLVQNGRYEFDSINYPSGSRVNIRVEQVSLSGKRTTVYDRGFSQDKDLLAPGQKQFLVFSGVDNSAISSNITLFGDKFDYKYVQPIKFISGSKLRVGLSDKLTMGVNVAKDIIIRQPSKLFLENTYDVSSSRFYRTGRTSAGSIISVDMDYVPSENLRISSEIAISKAASKVDLMFDPNGTDAGGYAGFDYTKPNFTINTKVFSYGSDFYSPGSNGITDRRGFELNSTWRAGPIDFNGSITRYNSNLDNFFEGGQTEILDYSLYASGKIDDKSDIIFGVRSTSAANAVFIDADKTFDVTIKRKISDKMLMSVNYAKTFRNTKAPESYDINRSSNQRLNAELSYDAEKLGILRLSHEMLMLDPVERLIAMGINQNFFTEPTYSKNIRLSLDRSHLPLKGFTISPNVGYRYGGENKGVNFGMNLGYVFKQGRQLVLSYAYNSTFSKYMPGSFSFGGNNYHTFSFNFNDSIGSSIRKGLNTPNSYQSSFDQSTGVIKGSVFIDVNQNGIKDPDEISIPGVDIELQNLYEISSDKNGNFIAANIPQGLRKVGINKATLPVIYSPTVSSLIVNVKPQKTYVANLGVTLTPGTISGKVELDKDKSSKTEVVIQLLDKNGKEIRYTTTDNTGEYYLEGVAPGDYTVAVDKNYLDYQGLDYDRSSKHKVNVPVVWDDFVNISGIDFNLIPKHSSEVKEF